MGSFFVMSKMFDKRNAEDFGFITNGENEAINPQDKSIWIKQDLFDYGWGKENGFYKFPLPDFNTLFKLVLYSKNNDDMYGAAAIILDKYPEKLLGKCEKLMIDRTHLPEFKRLINIFDLKTPRNRCRTLNKSYIQIKNDFERWKRVSKFARCAENTGGSSVSTN